MAKVTRDTERRPAGDPRRGRFAAHAVFAMTLVIFAEVMLFAGFISAFVIAENSVVPGTWPPPGQPRLPAATTALNTAALLASGVVLFLARRAFARGSAAAHRRLGAAVVLGAGFVVFQGAEWARLLAQGLTLTSSQVGSFFYLIVGAHALHALVALLVLGVQWRRMARGRLTGSAFAAAQLLWYFVVLVWPAIYLVVYL